MKFISIIIENGTQLKTYFINPEKITGFLINENQKTATIYIDGNTELTSIKISLENKDTKTFFTDLFNSACEFELKNISKSGLTNLA